MSSVSEADMVDEAVPLCVICNEKEIKGEVDGIRVTLACKDCCIAPEAQNESKKILSCKTRSLNEFKLKPSDLDGLHYKCMKNPHYRSASSMLMYLRAELKVMSEKRAIIEAAKVEKKRISDEKKDATRIARIAKMEQTLQTRKETLKKKKYWIEDIDPTLRNEVLGDYLDSTKSKVKVGDIKKGIEIHEKVRGVKRLKLDPIATFHYFKTHHDGDIDKLSTFSQLATKTIGLQSSLIAEFLTKEDFEILTETSLKIIQICTLRKRREYLEKKYNIDEVDDTLKEGVFGDYLESAATTIRLEEVELGLRVHKKALFVSKKTSSEPIISLNYFKYHEHDTTDRLIHLMKISGTAIRLFSLQIGEFLTPVDLKKLTDTPLNNIVQRVNEYKKDSAPRLKRALMNLVMDETIVDNIIKSPACFKRISRYSTYNLDVNYTAKALFDFWNTRDNTKMRRAALANAMKKKYLSIREDSSFCAEYIAGNIDVELDEIVGIMKITSNLFELGYKYWSNYADNTNAHFIKFLYASGKSLDEAIISAMKTVPNDLPPEDDEDDYYRWERRSRYWRYR